MPREPRYNRKASKLPRCELVVSVSINLTLTTSCVAIALPLVLAACQLFKYL